MPTYAGADGAALHYDVHGDVGAAPLIVLAGGAACHPDYLGDLAGLGQDWQLVVPHLRGVGLSPAPVEVEQGSFWRQAGDVDRLRAHLGLDRCVVAGHSAGTRLAMSYAVQHPGQVAGMLLITPPSAHLVEVAPDGEHVVAGRRGDPVFDAAVAAREAGPDTSSTETFNQWQQAIAPVGYATWGEVEQAHARRAHYHLAAARAFFSVEPPADLAKRLATVTAPVLVVAGAQDAGTGVAPVKALAQRFPAGQVEVIEQCGHFPWVEQPAAFRAAVDPFLRSVLG